MKTYPEKENLIILQGEIVKHFGTMSFDQAAEWILNATDHKLPEHSLTSPYDYFNHLQTEDRNRPLENWTIARAKELTETMEDQFYKNTIIDDFRKDIDFSDFLSKAK